MYQADHDDKYPVNFSTNSEMSEVLFPYTKNDAIFLTINPEGGEMVPNEQLEGINAAEIMSMVDTVMLFETKDWPGGGRNFAFTDGHAKYFRNGSDPSLNFDPFFDPYPADPLVE